MINGPDAISTNLSNIYTNNSQTIADSLVRIASGKRISVPGDDFAGFIRASGLQSDVDGYRNIKQDLQDASALVTYGKGVGNTIVEDLTRMKELADLYGQTSDADKQAAYTTEYDTIVDRITATKAGSYYDTTQVYQAGALTTVNINTEGAQNVSVTTTAIGDETAVNDITTATTGAIQNEINNANTYVTEMESFGKVIDRTIKLTDTIISSKNATISAITEIDEAEELSALTVKLVRQDATIAMLAQAHFVNGLALYLYENVE
jgi:flagellin-like hook-associated protein FlgL